MWERCVAFYLNFMGLMLLPIWIRREYCYEKHRFSTIVCLFSVYLIVKPKVLNLEDIFLCKSTTSIFSRTSFQRLEPVPQFENHSIATQSAIHRFEKYKIKVQCFKSPSPRLVLFRNLVTNYKRSGKVNKTMCAI